MKQEKPVKSRSQSRFNIDVTERDIAKAKRGDSYICVVSQAIARAIPDATRIETDNQTIRFSRQGERYVFLTPYSVAGYVVAFDAGESIQPFKFQLRNPARVMRKRFTPEGHQANRARNKARRRVVKKARVAGLPLDSPEVIAEMRAETKAAYDDAVSKVAAGTKQYTATGRPAPPRVFKRKLRTYGHRLLRINNPGRNDAL